ncbi:sigma-54-dependent transcriptional regulator [Microbulbifer pacificus]|uniref:Sigma-54 dependent transcriptional regulator n=1 Tax=Microbulbifer pacificus TaxID=407164 RepID=A0AAU0N127_9GAMM|nr:sigma-54 dependent transcriptional regulator [Microbulbifer pacificus]WOX06682.1 sigma-54 dependent transcriptional regulator [Microbulbifer pacificus]
MADRQPIALVVDDEPDICNLISMTLQRMDVRADIAMSVAEARRRLAEKHYDFCLTDMRLPDGDGLQVVEAIQELPADRALPVAVITAHGNMDTAIAALKLGAFDFVSKPVNLERLRNLVQLALRLNEGRFLARQEFPALFQGQSDAIQALRVQIEKIARSDAPVHITGEAGSGKELAARCIHDQGPRCNRAFVPVHCATIPAEQLEPLLFGGPIQSERASGLLQTANGGTLYFDDVTELPQDIQVKLLRAIQEKGFRSAATGENIKLDIRILTGSRKPLTDEVRAGRFRSDLYYLINVIELAIPPLRERREDIPLLTRNVLRRISSESRGAAAKASQDAVLALQTYSFPGNLRELENILERAVTLGESSTLYARDLVIPAASPIPCNTGTRQNDLSPLIPPSVSTGTLLAAYPGQFSSSDFETLDDFLQSIEREAIESALGETGGNKTAAAEKLGISFRSLRYRLKKLNMEE